MVAGPNKRPLGDPILPIYKGRKGIIIATGPSLIERDVQYIRKAQENDGLVCFTINNVYQRFPTTDVHLSCDGPWWHHYWPNDPLLREIPCPKFTWYPEIANKFKIDYIAGDDTKSGLSTDPRIIHVNHGSGPMAVNLAYHYGIRDLYLIGHDMKYPLGYKPEKRDPGGDRHYFGEYPRHLQHWPSAKRSVDRSTGALIGLIAAYESFPIAELHLNITNLTPETMLDTFPRRDLREAL